jgi:hypothetical protein
MFELCAIWITSRVLSYLSRTPSRLNLSSSPVRTGSLDALIPAEAESQAFLVLRRERAFGARHAAEEKERLSTTVEIVVC